MRVRQVQTLVWLGNALVLAGAGWVAWNFVETKKAQARTVKAEWPEVAAKPLDARWPGDVKGFSHIWETPVNGDPPPPPKGPEGPVVKTDPAAEFRGKLQVTGGILGTSRTTTVNFTVDGKPATLRLGEFVEGAGRSWQFVRIEYDREKGAFTARFVSGDLDVVVTQTPAGTKPLTDSDAAKFVAEYVPGGVVDPRLVREDRIDRPAFLDRVTGEWTVTAEESLWWETYGETAFLDKVSAKSETDPEGNARGVRLMALPSPPALAGGRGLRQGDLILSVNGVPMRDLRGVTDWLRGDGRGLARYVVVVERDGAERTVVYNVERRGSERSP